MGLLSVASVAQEAETSTWFVDNTPFRDVDDFMRRQGAALGMTEATAAYRILEERQDEYGRHIRIQRTQEGYDVLGGDGWIHVRRSGSVLFGGGHVPPLGSLPSIRLDARTAIARAVTMVSMMPGVRLDLSDETLASINASLVVIQRDMDKHWTHDGNIVLAYAIDVSSMKGSIASIYIDASNGEMVRSVRVPTCSTSGQTITLYNGLQDFWVTPSPPNYYLIENCMGYGGQITTTYAGFITPSSSLFWSTTAERTAASAHWAAEETVKYFYGILGRNGWNGSGGGLDINIVTSGDVEGAGINPPSGMGLGIGGVAYSTGPYVSLDVVAHEFTHLINWPRLNYFRLQGGALHESFSDIFGTMVEANVETGSWDWFIGEDFYIPDGKIRDMSNPKSKFHPNTYEGMYWHYTDSSEYFHNNAGVQNYWFYLLSQGGSGTNDKGFTYSVSGIGKDKATQIAYQEMLYLPFYATFSDAKNASIYAASELYGNCSNELVQTINAWNAVGVSSTNAILILGSAPVNCPGAIQVHNALQIVDRFMIDDMEADCPFVANGTQVTFHAGESILLKPGFQSGDKFLAYIDPCLAIAKHAGPGGKEDPDHVAPARAKFDPFRLYPNPTNNGQVLLVWAPDAVQGTPSTLRVLDINGRLVREERVVQGPGVPMDLSSESQGTYIIEVSWEGMVHRERLILMH